MTSSIKEILKAKKYPTFIKNNAVFKKFDTVKKIFPEIGLANCREEIEIDCSAEAMQAAQDLNNRIYNVILNKYYSLSGRAKKNNNLIELFKNLVDSLQNKRKINKTPAGKFTLNLPSDILDIDKKVVFKSGEGLFRVYNKLNELLKESKISAMTKLENMVCFKQFSTKNVPSKKYNVVFSSDGEDGVWDIATMSARGIRSCQSWGAAGGHNRKLIGSIVDPFTGIIYIEGNKETKNGSTMLRRCVVRFLAKNDKPFIGIETMYPAYDIGAENAFIDFIKKKTNDKFEVIFLKGHANAYIPTSKIVDSLPPNNLPYTDNGVGYGVAYKNIYPMQEKFRYKMQKISNDCCAAVKIPKAINYFGGYLLSLLSLYIYDSNSGFKSLLSKTINDIVKKPNLIDSFLKMYNNSYYYKNMIQWDKRTSKETKLEYSNAIKKYLKEVLENTKEYKKESKPTALDEFTKSFN